MFKVDPEIPVNCRSSSLREVAEGSRLQLQLYISRLYIFLQLYMSRQTEYRSYDNC